MTSQSQPITHAAFAPVRSAEIDDGRSRQVSRVVLAGTVRVIEGAVLATLGVGIAAVYVEGALPQYVLGSLATAVLGVTIMDVMGLYNIPAMMHRARQLPRIFAAWTITMAALAASVFFLKVGGDFSRVWLAAWLASGAAALAVMRFALAQQLRTWAKAGRLTRRAVIYGSGEPVAQLIAALKADQTSDIRICGVFDDRGDERSAVDGNVGRRGRLDDLIAFSRQANIDLVLLALPISAESRLMDLLHRLWVLPADIRLAASASRLRLARRAYSWVGNVALIALADKPIADWGTVAKWTFDKVIGTLALVALAPVMALVAIAIKLDSRGPVLFRQKRYGFNNELIEVFKFRSMYIDKTDHAASKLVTKDDPRVTKVGRFIRKTSLDELPQLFNVIIGNLSLVGPRPHAVSAKAGTKLYDEAVDGYFARHKVKPGITGWAQINGWRGETDTEEKLRHRIEHDLYYIENWSVFFDAYILAKTPVSLIKSENAY